MKSIGRRNSFFSIGIFSIFVAMLDGYAISISNFYLFCFSTFLLGTTYSYVMQYRFAAMESVTEDLIPTRTQKPTPKQQIFSSHFKMVEF